MTAMRQDAQEPSPKFCRSKVDKTSQPPPIHPSKGRNRGRFVWYGCERMRQRAGGEVELFSQPNRQKTVLVWCCGKFGRAETGTKGDNIKCDGNIEKGHRTATCQQSGCEPALPFMLVFASFYTAVVLGPRLSSTRTAAASRAGSRMTPRETHSMVWAWERDAWASVTPAAAKWRREERISVNSRM